MKGDANKLIFPGLYGGHLDFKVDEGHFYRDNICADSHFCWLFHPAKKTFNCQAKPGKHHDHQVPSEETIQLATVYWASKLRVIRKYSDETITQSIESVVSTWPGKISGSITGILQMFAPTLQQFQIMAEHDDPYVRYFTEQYGEGNLSQFCRAILQPHLYWPRHGKPSSDKQLSSPRKEGKQNSLNQDKPVQIQKNTENTKNLLERTNSFAHCYSLRKRKTPVIRYQSYQEIRKYQVEKQCSRKDSGLTRPSIKSDLKFKRQFLLRPPTNFQVESVTESTAKVTWLPSSDVSRNRSNLYRVRYWTKKESVSSANEMKINLRQNDCYLQLDPEKIYYADITVITKAGRQISPTGNILSIITPAKKVKLDKEEFLRHFSLVRKD